MIWTLKELGEKCKRYRVNAGYYQTDVARDLGYSVENISAFENGRNDNCFILLWYFEKGMSIDDLKIRSEVNDNDSERVAETPDKIEQAIEQFEKYNITYDLKNEITGHFHCRRASDGKLFQFYAGTGKIQGCANERGLYALIKMLTR